MRRLSGPQWFQRALAAVCALVVVPAVLSFASLLQDAPIRAGEPSPRTVIASQEVTVLDEEATERARRAAAAAVEPVLVNDDEARAGIVQQVQDAFEIIAEVRVGSTDGEQPPAENQEQALLERIPALDQAGAEAAVALTDGQLDAVTSGAVDAARQLARQRIAEDAVERVRTEQLPSELLLRSFPGEVAELVVQPVIAAALRPTVAVDEAATQELRDQEAEAVGDVETTFTPRSVIVRAGDAVTEVQLAALRQLELVGSDPLRTVARAAVLTLLLVAAVCFYLRAYRASVWNSTGRLVLLAILFLLYAVALEVVTALAPTDLPALRYLLPAGAIAMLATILFDPPIGVLMAVPVVAVTAFSTPNDPGVIVFAGVAGVLSAPLVSRLSARGDLRRAAWRSTLGYAALAGMLTAVFGELDQVPVAVGAGLANGVLTAVIVNGLLPFLESVFGILTATSLLDLADRNHPLLRELEQKALGSYNHSIMVSTMVERAARRVNADHLLGSVAALYHDIGKVRRPYFFVENQFGIDNPHDELAPEQSALIIQEHVTDGIALGRSFRLPAEVVEGIATHHGTTLVSFFHRKALEASGGVGVDEEHFRYKGRKPAGKEMAILMLADCCEGASRAAAQHNRALTRTDLAEIVTALFAERVEDGQLDESSLTFLELRTVQESFIETLVGVYHPRIAYPPKITRGTDEPEALMRAAEAAGAMPSNGESQDGEAARAPVPRSAEEQAPR